MNNSIIYEDVKKIVDSVDLSPLSGKEILITGATGLVGTYILFSINELIERGVSIKKVHALTVNGLPDHLKEIEKNEWISIIKADLSNDSACDRLPCADYIIHAAGYGQPAKFIVDESRTIKLNTVVLFKLFDKIKENGSLVFISSSGIYNGLQKDVYTEEDVGTTNTMHPRACYIEGKRCGEAICNAFRKKGINAKSIRLSYTYGPGIRRGDKRVLYDFIDKGINGRIGMFDKGDAQRRYCYVSDVVEILFNVLLYGKEPIYNVGGTEDITVKELAITIGKLLHCPVIEPQVESPIPGNAAMERLDISKIKKEFSKSEFIPYDIGIKRTIEWMQTNYYNK